MRSSLLSVLVALAACTPAAPPQPATDLAVPWFADLDADQAARVDVILRDHVERLADLDPGSLDTPAQAEAIAGEVQARLSEVLTPVQLARYEALQPVAIERDSLALDDTDQESLDAALEAFAEELAAIDPRWEGAADAVADAREALRQQLVDTLGASLADDVLADFPDVEPVPITDHRQLETEPEPPLVMSDVQVDEGPLFFTEDDPSSMPWVYAGSKWSERSLTYCLDSYSPDMLVSSQIEAVQRAAQEWSGQSGMLLVWQSDCGGADIQLGFRTGYHWDGCTFPWNNSVLANGYFPSTGVIHFSDSYFWDNTLSTSDGGYDLQAVATHELGHALGLDHSSASGAPTMTPNYHTGWRSLSADDLAGVRALYGNAPDFCATAASLASSGFNHIDLGEYYAWLDSYSGNPYATSALSLHRNAEYYGELARRYTGYADTYGTSYAWSGEYYAGLAASHASWASSTSYQSHRVFGSSYGWNAYWFAGVGSSLDASAVNYELYCRLGY